MRRMVGFWDRERGRERERQCVTVIDKTGRKYRPLSKGWGGVKDFGEMSAVSVVLPIDHGSLRLSRMVGSEAQNTK